MDVAVTPGAATIGAGLGGGSWPAHPAAFGWLGGLRVAPQAAAPGRYFSTGLPRGTALPPVAMEAEPKKM